MTIESEIRWIRHVQYSVLLGLKRDLRDKLNLDFSVNYIRGPEPFNFSLHCNGCCIGVYSLSEIGAICTALLFMHEYKLCDSISLENIIPTEAKN